MYLWVFEPLYHIEITSETKKLNCNVIRIKIQKILRNLFLKFMVYSLKFIVYFMSKVRPTSYRVVYLHKFK